MKVKVLSIPIYHKDQYQPPKPTSSGNIYLSRLDRNKNSIPPSPLQHWLRQRSYLPCRRLPQWSVRTSYQIRNPGYSGGSHPTESGSNQKINHKMSAYQVRSSKTQDRRAFTRTLNEGNNENHYSNYYFVFRPFFSGTGKCIKLKSMTVQIIDIVTYVTFQFSQPHATKLMTINKDSHRKLKKNPKNVHL